MQVTVQPQEFEEVRVPAGMRVRAVVTAQEQIDIALVNAAQYDAFCESDDGSELARLSLRWVEEERAAEFLVDMPDEPCWLILWNAYEDDPVSVEYEITPL